MKPPTEILAACHVHSDWSYDAKWTLRDLSTKFARSGYRVLMMTEHDKGFSSERLAQLRAACAEVTTDQLLVIPGIEYSDAANQVHVLVWGDVPFLGEGLPTTEMLRRVKSFNGIAVLAHPSRRKAWAAFDPEWAEALLGIELWNRKYDGWAPGAHAPELLARTAAVPFVGLDFHSWRQSFPLGMALEIDSAVSEQTVLDCMRARRVRARAFGTPVEQPFFRAAVPALNAAESTRRTVARVVRQLSK